MIRKLAVTGTQVKATVAIGTNEFGGFVTTDVVLPRKADEVAAALVTLENLCLREAQTFVRTARDRMELEALVEQGVAKRVGKERERIARDAAGSAERRVRDLEQSYEREQGERRRAQDANERLQQQVNNQQAELTRLRTQLAEQEGSQ